MDLSHGEAVELLVRGARIAGRRWGAGAPVLCLHATGHDSLDYALFAQRLQDRFQIVAIDWPGQGASPEDGNKPRAQHYADIALAVIAQLDLRAPIVIGNSIGGAAAIVAAAQAPERIGALVLCNPGGLAPLDFVSRFAIGRMVAFFDAGTRGASWYPAAFRAYYEHLVLPRAPKAHRELIIAKGQELAPLLAEAWRGFAEPDADLRDTAASLKMPVWCAWAKGDQLVAWGRSQRAVKRIPEAHWTLFRGGHAAFLEDSERFASVFEKLTTPATERRPKWRLSRA